MDAMTLSSDAIARLFGVASSSHWEQLILFDTSTGFAGFSAQRRYPEKEGYLPPSLQDGTPDTFALVRVAAHLTESEPDLHQWQLRIDISKHSRYLYNRFDYDFSDPASPTRDSVLRSRATRQPLDLEFYDHYILRVEDGNLCLADTYGRDISAEALLDSVFRSHTRTSSAFSARRWHYRSGRFLFGVVDETLYGFKTFTKTVLRFEIEESTDVMAYLNPIQLSQLKSTSVEYFEFQGYRASKRSIIIVSLVSVSGYALARWSGVDYGYFRSIFTNPFLSVCAVILLVSTTDVLLPRSIRLVINSLIWMRRQLIRFSRKKD